MTIQRHFKLALTAGHTIPLVINANQYDSGEQWLFTLYNDGVRYTPSSGAIVGIKADRLGIINTGTVDANGRVVINETRQMTAAVGKNIFELLIDDQTHGTANFMVLVEPRPGDNADLSESDYSLFEEAINGTSQAAIKAGVQEWMNENLTDPTDPIVDASLSLSGAAADAKKTGDEISDLKSALDSKVEVASSDSDTVTLRYKSNGTNVLAPVPSAFAFDELAERVGEGLVDNAVTRPKIADHAVSMAKTDFYYSGSLAKEYSWIYTYFSTYMRVMCKWTEMDTILNEFPEKLSIVFVGVTDYWYSGGGNMSMATTNHTKSIPRSYNTITVDGVTYGILEFLRSDFETAYNELKTYVDNGESWKDAQFQVTNSATRVPSDTTVYFIAGEVTSELIELNFSTTVISSDFVSAVQAAMSGGSGSGTSSYEEELAKARLTGKVMINFGDSYTKNMATFCSTLATKYGMVADDQGTNGATVIGNFPTKANDVVTAYTNGRTIGGVTYHAEDVAFITFMGGANDGAGINTYIGTGLSDTSTSRIYGAVQSIFKLFANTFTNAKIIVIAQPSNYNQSVSSFTTEAQATALGFASLADLQRLDDYQLSEYMMYNKEKAIMEVAKAYSFPLIDMFSNFPSMLNPANRTAYWQSDKIHVNTAGSQLIVNALEKKIVELTVG